jgi:UDP-N-acetylmuramoyl-tripeptide--D-alanyl-D-alanine ligase
MTLAEIAAALGVQPPSGESAWIAPRRVQTDSRKVEPGDLFVCLQGEKVDGREFAAQAVSKGAVAVLAEAPAPAFNGSGSAPVLLVEQCVPALGRLAAYHRGKTKATVIGVTGTAGKTTVKEMIASICGLAGATAKNHLNLNNQIGLPVSMLQADGDEKYWVFELGISQPRDMDELGSILNPDVALVVNVGPAHLEGLVDVVGVAYHKTRLFHYLQPNGVGVFSLDYPELAEAAPKAWTRVIGFSCHGKDARFKAEYVEPADCDKGRYKIQLDARAFMVELPWRGDFGAENGLAAASAAYMAGIDPETIRRGLEAFKPAEQRFSCCKLGGLAVVDDTYNANPLSMTETMRSAAALANGEPLVLVLGEMRELGLAAEAAHEQIGRAAGALKPLAVFWRGGHAQDVARGLASMGFGGAWATVDDADSFMAHFKKLDLRCGVVFFKGSRGTRMEELSAPLMQELKQ